MVSPRTSEFFIMVHYSGDDRCPTPRPDVVDSECMESMRQTFLFVFPSIPIDLLFISPSFSGWIGRPSDEALV